MFGRRKIVDEIPLAGHEPPIFDATHRRTDPGACDLLFSFHVLADYLFVGRVRFIRRAPQW